MSSYNDKAKSISSKTIRHEAMIKQTVMWQPLYDVASAGLVYRDVPARAAYENLTTSIEEQDREWDVDVHVDSDGEKMRSIPETVEVEPVV